MDSYFVRMEDPKEIKVGEKVVFWGECGLEIAGITLTVDGFEIGKATFEEDSLKLGYRTWTLSYTFKGAGAARSLQVLANDLKGSASYVCRRTQDLKVEPSDVRPMPGKIEAKIVESKVRHTTQGQMELEGLVVHYTAGQQSTDPSGAINMANDPEHPPYAYWVLASDGTIYKTHELNRWGYHCATKHHRTHLGIEIMCPGKLTRFENKFYPWFNLDRTGNPKGPAWPEDQIRQFLGNRLQTPGYYAKYTEAQERALIGLVQYLKDNCPEFKLANVVGHDEILPDWKDDPGGSLSMSMPDFRGYLKKVIV
jgi:N-acetyl-anhydromuramyl-L-alanine amidase AmpD